MNKDMRVFSSVYIILAVLGVLIILNWGGYLETDWMPSTLTLITLESAGILAATLLMVVIKIRSNARDRT